MKFTSRLSVAAALLALVAVPAFAQTPPAAPSTPAAPAIPAPVPALPQPDVPPEKLAVARQVVEGSGMSRSFDPMVPQLEEQIPMVITRSRPELGKDVAVVLTQLQPEFDKKSTEMLDIAARIYARRMSMDDLKATAAFFQSPAGMHYKDSQPLMLDELVLAMQSWTQQTSQFMMKRVQQEMEKRGQKF